MKRLLNNVLKIGLVVGVGGIVRKLKKNDPRYLVCSPMMDDGFVPQGSKELKK